MKKKKNYLVNNTKKIFCPLSKRKKIFAISIFVILLSLLITIPTTIILIQNNRVNIERKNVNSKTNKNSNNKKKNNKNSKEQSSISIEDEENSTLTENLEKDTTSTSENSSNSSSTTEDSSSSTNRGTITNGSNSGNTENSNPSTNTNTNTTSTTTPPPPNEREILQQLLSNGGHSWDFSTESDAYAEVSSWRNRGFVAGYGFESVGSLTAYYVYVSTPIISEDCGKIAHTINWKNTPKTVHAIDYLVQNLHYSCSNRCSPTQCY